MKEKIISLFVKSFCNSINVDYDFLNQILQENFSNNNSIGASMIAKRNFHIQNDNNMDGRNFDNRKSSTFWQQKNYDFSVKGKFEKPHLKSSYKTVKRHRWFLQINELDFFEKTI